MFGFQSTLVLEGQNEAITTNAPVGYTVHWMGCVFSFNIKWGSSQSISFVVDHCMFFGGFVLGFFSLDLTSHIATLLTFLPS
jgi:hypothetical protein